MDGLPPSQFTIIGVTTQTQVTIPVVPVTLVGAEGVSHVEAQAVDTNRFSPVQQEGSRTMIVELPANVYPFSVIQVPTPEGKLISVSIFNIDNITVIITLSLIGDRSAQCRTRDANNCKLLDTT